MAQELRQAARALARTPGFTAIALATLAVAIGATSAFFSVVNGVLLRPLPYRDPSRLVQLWGTDPQQTQNRQSPGDYLDLRQRAKSFERLAGYEEKSVDLSGPGEPQRIRGAEVTADFFEVFGVPAEIGRTFRAIEDRPGSGRRAVISDALWTRSFHRTSSVLGKPIRIDGQSAVVVGVLPPSFDWPRGVELWTLSGQPVPVAPLALRGNPLENRELQYFDAVARLAPNVDSRSAQAEIVAIARDLERRYPQTDRGRSWRLVPLQEQLVGNLRRPLTILLAAVTLVWLIACANIATLLLARATRRHREMAIRSALGASRARLVRQLLTEGLLLALMGGAAGLLVAAWGTRLLIRLAPPEIPRLGAVALDGRTMLVALALSVATGLLFGLAPALPASGRRISPVLVGGTRATSGAGPVALRMALVVAELALTLVLLSGAGLLLQSFLRLTRVDPGFAPEGLLAVALPLPQIRYPDARHQSQFYEDLLRRLRVAPEVAAAATVFPVPLYGGSATTNVTPEERGPSAEGPLCEIASISTGYFQLLQVPLRAGRDFDARDRADAPQTAIVGLTLASRLWPGGNAVGHRVRIGSGFSAATARVVGVVPDLRLQRLNDAPPPAIYLPMHQFVLPLLSVVARGRRDSSPALAAIRREVRGLDPELPIGDVRPVERIVEDSIAQPRFRAWMLGAFAAAALCLASVGVYGIVSGSVLARTRELAVRIALGARPGQVRQMILREGLVLAGFGIALGLAGALALTRVLQSLLYGIGATDVPTLLGVCLLLAGAVLLASLLPARRATRVDPIVSLRSE